MQMSRKNVSLCLFINNPFSLLSFLSCRRLRVGAKRREASDHHASWPRIADHNMSHTTTPHDHISFHYIAQEHEYKLAGESCSLEVFTRKAANTSNKLSGIVYVLLSCRCATWNHLPPPVSFYDHNSLVSPGLYHPRT